MREEGRSMSVADMRPPLLGFDQHAAHMLMLTNQVVALRLESNVSKAEHIQGPMFPMEIVDQRLARFAATKRADAIARAFDNWRDKHEMVSNDA